MNDTTRAERIRSLPEPGRRPALAKFVATDTTYNVAQAKTILSSAPLEVDEQDDSATDVLALARSLGLKGFTRSGKNKPQN